MLGEAIVPVGVKLREVKAPTEGKQSDREGEEKDESK